MAAVLILRCYKCFISTSTRDKYLKHDWQLQDFIHLQVEEILNGLMGSGGQNPNTSVNDNFFMDSDLYHTIVEHLM